MLLTAIVALVSASVDSQRIACAVRGTQIVVRFFSLDAPEIDKFAVVQAGTLQGGEWRFVIDEGDESHPPLRLSPYRPGVKRLVIDTRRQLAVRYVEATGKARIVRAFPKPGLYTLIFSDNLMTELENMASWECKVRIM